MVFFLIFFSLLKIKNKISGDSKQFSKIQKQVSSFSRKCIIAKMRCPQNGDFVEERFRGVGPRVPLIGLLMITNQDN